MGGIVLTLQKFLALFDNHRHETVVHKSKYFFLFDKKAIQNNRLLFISVPNLAPPNKQT